MEELPGEALFSAGSLHHSAARKDNCADPRVWLFLLEHDQHAMPELTVELGPRVYRGAHLWNDDREGLLGLSCARPQRRLFVVAGIPVYLRLLQKRTFRTPDLSTGPSRS